MKLTYRPEIDGLRAIAVGAVILYHAQITILGHQPFKGGFIGVDIFFVISGYLITSIILKELITTDSFSFKHFYEKRIRRILPALLFVMLVSLPFAWIYLLPISLIDFLKSILYSLGFSSNFYFHYSGQQYGAESGLLKPFLHTWSLSVEEQFYILFPILLLVTFKYFRQYLIHILILGFIISLGLADWGSRNHPSFNFYVLPTRGWELLAGSILAYFEITLGHRSKNKTLNLMLPTIGLLLIGHSILFFNDKMFHPSLYSLSPIIGVCLIIWFSQKDEIITKILSTKLFVGIGLISYSLYLWHYPIFAFARINLLSEDDIINKIILIIVALVFAVISYYLIEKPFREKFNKNNKSIFFLFFVYFLIFIICIFFYSQSKIFMDFEKKYENIIYKKFRETWGVLKTNNTQCHNNFEGCFINHQKENNVLIVGDSHASWILNYLAYKIEIADKRNLKTFTANSCFPLSGFKRLDLKTNKELTNCSSDYIEKVYKILIKEENSVIILYAYWEQIFEDDLNIQFISKNDESLTNSFLKLINELKKNNKVIIVYPTPTFKKKVPDELFVRIKNYEISKHFMRKKETNFLITSDLDELKDKNKNTLNLFDSIEENNNLKKVFSYDLFCNQQDTICFGNDKDNIFFRDTNHLSSRGSEILVDKILSAFDN